MFCDATAQLGRRPPRVEVPRSQIFRHIHTHTHLAGLP